MRFFRKKGISLLVPTQNVEQTVELCLRSFKDFPDEMIVVDNGSTDNTIDIVRSLEGEIPNMRFYEAPHLKDLYENRQYAFERSKYEWIVRIDSDYIAYTSGQYDIKNLRAKILQTRKGIRPKAFGITHVNLFGDFFHTGVSNTSKESTKIIHVKPPMSSLPYRIIQWYPGMRFQRNGRWEGIRWQGASFFKHSMIKTPYWFHCTIKTKVDWLIRYERNNWRELGDFETYPTREDYIREVILQRYGTTNFEKAAERHWEDNVKRYIVKYNPENYYPYPDLILNHIQGQENV
ncbi:MAG TPA: glycosyltransferase [Saprospiraceae bacterium]|nr:glycosyltransferase [Saprospiraceae bacterium]